MSNNQWPGTGGQPQQGYPQQPPSQSGYPQQPSFTTPQQPGYQQPSFTTPQQPGYGQQPHGQQPSFSAPQPGYQQPSYQQPGYGQQGFQPVHGPAGQGMPPQKRGNAGLIIALVVVLVAILAFGTWWILSRNNQPTANPTSSTQTTAAQETQGSEKPSSASTKKSTDPTSSSTRSRGSSTTPEMPGSFGNFTLDTKEDGAYTYKNSNGDVFVAAHGPGETVEANSTELTNIEKVGKWTCGKNSNDIPMCLAEAHSGTVATLMIDEPFSTLAEVSDSFLDAWR
ncbi:flagellar basal body-associated protein FliL [[Pseudopropionibacterium] massiliense]|uniref:flagellar basal body-associated protein FliL n=1 Tax=[Pseudopropionibacterium] massiliense TaxID=2220000 RepID=UPI0010307638|nr:flagellar basal body-associated protein FliL [[Pseudopropionibacterium] massiliense]